MEKRIVKRKRMPKVIELRPSKEKIINDAIIDLLEDLLEKAEQGTFNSFIFSAGVTEDDAVMTSYVGPEEFIKQQNLISFLQSNLNVEMFQESLMFDLTDLSMDGFDDDED